MRVVIGEDQVLMREGLRLVLERAGFAIVGDAGDAPELVQRVRELEPDLVVTDIRMPPDHADDGLRAALELRVERPQLPVIVLSSTSTVATRPSCSRPARAASATCSSSGSPTSTRSSATSTGCSTARRCSTRSWSPRCSTGRGPTTSSSI